jgi:hypothetical protein
MEYRELSVGDLEKILGKNWYVQCPNCRTFTIVPEKQQNEVVFNHLSLFPEHRGITSGNSTQNLGDYMRGHQTQVAIEIFNS